MKKLLSMLMVASVMTLSGIAYGETKAPDSKSTDAVKERIAPVGKTCKAGEACAGAPAAAAAPAKSGKDVYTASCAMCHNPGLMNAPKFGNAADWAPRIAKGIETLNTHAISGFNTMPPKGTCAACTDAELKAAVKYMVDGSKK
ncbi:MAG: c-type cytochrome [Pseudomonadota bacterium]